MISREDKAEAIVQHFFPSCIFQDNPCTLCRDNVCPHNAFMLNCILEKTMTEINALYAEVPVKETPEEIPINPETFEYSAMSYSEMISHIESLEKRVAVLEERLGIDSPPQ